MSGTPRRRTNRSELTHISIAIDDALDHLQATAEECAARHGELAGPVRPEQRRWADAIDSVEHRRAELEDCQP